jgi:hypothetical protein
MCKRHTPGWRRRLPTSQRKLRNKSRDKGECTVGVARTKSIVEAEPTQSLLAECSVVSSTNRAAVMVHNRRQFVPVARKSLHLNKIGTEDTLKTSFSNDEGCSTTSGTSTSCCNTNSLSIAVGHSSGVDVPKIPSWFAVPHCRLWKHLHPPLVQPQNGGKCNVRCKLYPILLYKKQSERVNQVPKMTNDTMLECDKKGGQTPIQAKRLRCTQRTAGMWVMNWHFVAGVCSLQALQNHLQE